MMLGVGFHPRTSAAATRRSPLATRRTRGKLVLAGTGAALAALLFPVLHQPDLRLVWNVSPSVPLGLYRIMPSAGVDRGDLAAVRPSPALARFMGDRRYVEAGALLVKPVVAIGGAHVCRYGNRVTVDGRHIATALDRDRIGRPLPRWADCYRLRADQLFLIAPGTPGSFDSRYFGVIGRRSIVGRAVPLWTWP